MNSPKDQVILVTGATGYVAGRLIPLLLSAGYRIRAMGRSIPKMADRPWGQHPCVELVCGDIMDVNSLKSASDGCATIYYLVHSMVSQKGQYRQADQIGAKNMVQAASEAGAEHIIYLGGLGDIHHKHISRHLISRNEVGQILMQGSVPTTVLRAAMILGSGSASFEILRYLAERLPLMITPRWVSMPTQPISITNVLGYLKGCLEHPETRGRTFDIGGPDVVAYQDLFRIFARTAGLPVPVMIPVPVLTPRLSSLWIHLVTPVPAAIAQPLTEGLSLPTTCTENSITQIIPQELISCETAIQRALERVEQEQVDTCWADAGQIRYPEWAHYGDSAYAGGTILSDGYRAIVKGKAEDLWTSIVTIGGKTGYYGADVLWKIRGLIDVFSGGVGLSRGRRSGKELCTGDALDFWRVLEVKQSSRLLLAAEMKLPGEALLEIRIDNIEDQICEIVLLARFLPRGLLGMMYWYSLLPFHQYIFTRMLKGIVNRSGVSFIKFPEKYDPGTDQTCHLADE